MSLAKITVTGRLTKDPEMRDYEGKMITTINIAVNAGKIKDGEDLVNFYRASFWNKTAETIQKYLHKGDGVVISGNLRIRSYIRQDGTKDYSFDIEYADFDFGPRALNNQSAENVDRMPTVPASAPKETAASTVTPEEDELPF